MEEGDGLRTGEGERINVLEAVAVLVALVLIRGTLTTLTPPLVIRNWKGERMWGQRRGGEWYGGHAPDLVEGRGTNLCVCATLSECMYVHGTTPYPDWSDGVVAEGRVDNDRVVSLQPMTSVRKHALSTGGCCAHLDRRERRAVPERDPEAGRKSRPGTQVCFAKIPAQADRAPGRGKW